MYKYGKEWQHNLREKKQAYRLLNDKYTENMIKQDIRSNKLFVFLPPKRLHIIILMLVYKLEKKLYAFILMLKKDIPYGKKQICIKQIQ